jgi:transmembrane sensor
MLMSQLTEPTIAMNELERETTDHSRLQEEAQAWLARLTSCEATVADLGALNVWRTQSPAHGRAFAEAALLWNLLGDATRQAVARDPARPSSVRPRTLVGRRAFIGGGLLAASAAGAAAVVHPPLGLWPSWSEFAAEYRTHKGERRQIEVADSMAIQINTQTSIDLRPAADGVVQIELIAGEVAFASQRAQTPDVVVRAGSGQVQARNAGFNMRRNGNDVSVSCVGGEVLVSCGTGTTMLRNGQQTLFNERGMSQIAAIDREVVTAWQRGLLIFRDETLSHVIDEVNRYRFGKIVLLDGKLGSRRIVANFRLDRIDDVVDFVAEVVQARVRRLPGGIVLLG